MHNPKNKKLNASDKHQYFLGILHVQDAVKIFIGVGIFAIIGLLVFAAFYFRRAIFVLLIPFLVTLLTSLGVFKKEKRLIWPIIGISVCVSVIYLILE